MEATVAKLQRKLWVPGIRRIIKSVSNKCVTCNRLCPWVEGEKVGELFGERLKPSPPFCQTACDIFGPIKIRDVVKRRTLDKAFGIVFNCLSTQIVYVCLLVAFRRFVSISACSMYLDWGTQLMSASKELKQMFSKLDWSEIHRFGRKKSGHGFTDSP